LKLPRGFLKQAESAEYDIALEVVFTATIGDVILPKADRFRSVPAIHPV